MLSANEKPASHFWMESEDTGQWMGDLREGAATTLHPPSGVQVLRGQESPASAKTRRGNGRRWNASNHGRAVTSCVLSDSGVTRVGRGIQRRPSFGAEWKAEHDPTDLELFFQPCIPSTSPHMLIFWHTASFVVPKLSVCVSSFGTLLSHAFTSSRTWMLNSKCPPPPCPAHSRCSVNVCPVSWLNKNSNVSRQKEGTSQVHLPRTKSLMGVWKPVWRGQPPGEDTPRLLLSLP